jgi:holo-[acyl-carrier protein] synthase
MKGIGIDIVDKNRISEMSDEGKISLCRKVLNDTELKAYSYKISDQRLASHFAAKEAVSKALGTGFRGFDFSSISIFHDNLGKPVVKLNDKANDIALAMGVQRIFLTISHERDLVVAVCVIE